MNTLSYIDTVYTTTASTLSYNIRLRNLTGSTIYSGIARRAPNSAIISINVGRLIHDYLYNEISDFREINQYRVEVNSNAYAVFALTYFEYTGDTATEVLAETYAVLLGEDYGDTWDGGHKMMSKQISRHADSRQFGFLTAFNPTTAVTSVEIGYRDFEIVLSGSTQFTWNSGTSILTAVSCTNWSVVKASTTVSWLTVNKVSNRLVLNFQQNSGQERVGAFALCWPGIDMQPVCRTYYVEQGVLDWDFVFDEDLVEAVYSGETVQVGYTANGPYQWLSLQTPDWITGTVYENYVEFVIGENTGSTERMAVVSASSTLPSQEVLCTLTVEQDSNSYASKYLTFETISGGTIRMLGNCVSAHTIDYRKNDGQWVSINVNGSSAGDIISLDAGDKIEWRGENLTYAFTMTKKSGSTTYTYSYNSYFSASSDLRYNVYGNVLSLFYKDNFKDINALPVLSSDTSAITYTNKLNGLFSPGTNTVSSRGPVSAEKLILPTVLTAGIFERMFSGCASLTTAPELTTTALIGSCYHYMFWHCTSLNYIKCLAETGINTNSSTSSWVDSVASSGTFVKKSGITWPSGKSGIPSNWTVEQV